MVRVYICMMALFFMAQTNGQITGSVVIPDGALSKQVDNALSELTPDSETYKLVQDNRSAFLFPIKVRLINPANREIICKEILDYETVFSIENVNPGNYFLSVTQRGLMEHALSVSVGEGETVDIGKQFLLPERRCEGPFTLCKKTETAELFGSAGNPPEWNPDSVDAHFRSLRGVPVMNVCEYMHIRSLEPIDYRLRRAWVVGTLVQNKQGSWLQQKCDDSIKSGDYVWPNAIALIEGGKKNQGYKKTWLDVAEKVGLKDLIPKDACNSDFWNENGPCVVVYGPLETRDNLVAAPCGNGKLCGYGYGTISAPAQLTIEYIYYPDRPE